MPRQVIENSFQDWNPVVIRNPNARKKTEAVSKTTDNLPKKNIGGSGSGGGQDRKEDEEGIIYEVKKFTREFGRIVQQTRSKVTMPNGSTMTQFDLSNKLSVPKYIVKGIENGTAVYSGPLMAKVKKWLASVKNTTE